MGWTLTDTLPAAVVTDANVAGVIPSPLTKAAIQAIIDAHGGAINVRDFGALGNGTHDDTAAINAACATVDQSKNRMLVYVPAGTYMINGVNLSAPELNTRFIDAGIKPLAGTTFLMDPNAILKIIPNSSPSYTVFFLGVGQDKVTIKGGQLLGDRATHDYTTITDYPTFEFGYGITGRGAKDILVDSVKISGMIGDCVVIGCYGNDKSIPGYVDGSGDIINCRLSGARRNNISIIGSNHTLIENNYIEGAGQNDGVKDGTAPRMGIDLEWGVAERVSNITIRGNRFVNNKNGAIENFNGTGVVIEGNFADTGFVTGTHADGDNVIKGNVLIAPTDTTHTGISVASGLTPGNMGTQISDNIIIGFNTGIALAGIGGICSGNYVTQFADSGIVSYQGTEIFIVGNHVFDARVGSVGAGIVASTPYTGTNRVAIKSNNVSNVYVGILLSNSASGVIAESNTIRKTYRGIVIGGGCQGVFKNNILDMPGHAAGQDVDISYGPTANVVVIGNTIRNSSSYSIQGQSGGTGGVSRVLRNTIQDSTSTIAILLTDGTHYVVDNILSVNRASGSLYGIYIGNAAVACKVIGNIGYATGASPYGAFVNTSAATGTPASVVFGNMFDGATVVATHASDIVGENFSSTKTLASLTGVQTLTNKRITPRITTTTTASTLDVDVSLTDVAVRTGQAAALTINAPTGTPTDGQVVVLRITDNGTARAVVFNAAFRSLTAALPTTTVISTPLIVTARWNATDSKWDVLSFTSAAAAVGGGTALVTQYATAQSNTVYPIPAGAKTLVMKVIAGSGGAGSARRGAAGTVRCGGGPSGAPGYTEFEVPVAPLTTAGVTQLYVTVGAAGTGGAAVTADDTNGNNGTTGGSSSVSTATNTTAPNCLAFAATSTGGNGGTAVAGAAGFAGAGRWAGGNGGAASTTGGAGAAGTSAASAGGGGGSGAGLTTGNAQSAGGSGAYPTGFDPNGTTAGGTAGGGNGASGVLSTGGQAYGSAGAGGGSNASGAGGNGGDASRGAGAGGGGASVNGFNSGKGGDGSVGFVEITAYF